MRNNDTRVIEFLIQIGMNIEHKNNTGITGFMAACRGNNKNVVETLIKNGAKIEEKDMKGRTGFIHACCYNSNIDVIQFLIDYGINRESFDN